MKEGIAPSKLLSFIPPGMVSVLVLLHPSSETTDDPSKLARLLFREGVLFDLLCSRNARPQKALVGRAQWEIKQDTLPFPSQRSKHPFEEGLGQCHMLLDV